MKNQTFTILLFLIAPLFLNVNKPLVEPTTIQCFKLLSRIPILTKNGKFEFWKDSIMLYCNNKFALYKFAIPFTTQYSSINGNNRILTGFKTDSIIEGITYRYLFFEKWQKKGFLMYDSLSFAQSKKVFVDSVLSRTTFGGIKLYQSNLDTLIESNYINDNNILLEKNVPKSKLDDSFEDTTFLYYTSKISNIMFSLDKTLDSVKHMKLFKAVVKYNARFNKSLNMFLPEHSIIFEIKEAQTHNMKDVINFFDAYEKKRQHKIQ